MPGKGLTLIEKFEEEAKLAVYAFVLLTPDENIQVNNLNYVQARPNVIFELGWFHSRLGRDKVCIIMKKGTFCILMVYSAQNLNSCFNTDDLFLWLERSNASVVCDSKNVKNPKPRINASPILGLIICFIMFKKSDTVCLIPM